MLIYLLYVFVLQNTSNFSLVQSDAGEVVTEDGRSRCPFNPEYKSTAIVAGRSRGGGVSCKLVRVEVGLCVIDVQVILANRHRPMMGRQTAALRLGSVTWRSSPLAPVYSACHACVADGELYAGTVSNFQGNEPIIYKTLSQGTSLKTENSLNWLQGTRTARIVSAYHRVKVPRWTHEHVLVFFLLLSLDPAFVGSAYIQESLPKGNEVGDDDKIYFFFSEVGKEFDFFDNTIVSRIARVCKVSVALRQIIY